MKKVQSVFKFHIKIPNGKLADDMYFCLIISLVELCPFEKIKMKFGNQDVYLSKELGQLIL